MNEDIRSTINALTSVVEEAVDDNTPDMSDLEDALSSAAEAIHDAKCYAEVDTSDLKEAVINAITEKLEEILPTLVAKEPSPDMINALRSVKEYLSRSVEILSDILKPEVK